MALINSLNTALTGLQAAMAALQTTGHNISNASTPGFSRQRVDLQTQRPLDMARFQIGRGVSIQRISRVVDGSLEGRLRDSASTLAGLGIRSDTLQQLEALMGALSDSDLGAQVRKLFSSIQDFANHPDDLSTRSQVLQNASTVSGTLNSLAAHVRSSREQLNNEVNVSVNEINRITREIAGINRQVLSAENAGVDLGSANDLRDRRDLLVRQLSDFVRVSAVETSLGDLNVLAGSAFLVFGGESFNLTTTNAVEDGVQVSTPTLANGSASLNITDGKLRGLVDSRDDVLLGVGRDLDVLAGALAYEFNRVQSTGQGLKRFGDLTSLNRMQNAALPLSIAGSVTQTSTLDTLTDSSLIGFPGTLVGRSLQVLTGADILETRQITGFDPVTGTLFFDQPLPERLAVGDTYQVKELPFPITNGSFEVVVTNELTGTQQSFSITVDLDRTAAPDTTFADIVSQINALANITASLTGDNHIRIQSDSNDIRFSFANDTSGFLAAAGLNAFFTGSTADDIAVNPTLLQSPEFLSGARSGAKGDNANALAFSALRDLATIQGTTTFEDFYQGIVGGMGVQAAEFKNRFENQSLVAQQLENQRQRVSGVNIDEEAVHMIEFQRSFQASARFINVIDDLLKTLITGL